MLCSDSKSQSLFLLQDSYPVFGTAGARGFSQRRACTRESEETKERQWARCPGFVFSCAKWAIIIVIIFAKYLSWYQLDDDFRTFFSTFSISYNRSVPAGAEAKADRVQKASEGLLCSDP